MLLSHEVGGGIPASTPHVFRGGRAIPVIRASFIWSRLALELNGISIDADPSWQLADWQQVNVSM